MKSKKRVMVVGSILLGAVLAGGATVQAWGDGGWLGGRRGCVGWFHRGMGDGKEFTGILLRHLDGKVAALNLTAPQKARYDELRADIETHLASALEDRKAMRESVRAEMSKEVPEVATLTAMLKTRIQAMSGAMEKHLDLLTAFYDSLDPNQKKQLASEVRKRMAERGHHEADPES
jgi:Spy/CpxP family protein refolding chaperone